MNTIAIVFIFFWSQCICCPSFAHHDFRHFFAIICLESGVDIPTVSRWLGDKDGRALDGLSTVCSSSRSRSSKVSSGCLVRVLALARAALDGLRQPVRARRAPAT